MTHWPINKHVLKRGKICSSCNFNTSTCRLINMSVMTLTLTLLTWRIWWAPNNASKWQMEFNSAFKWLNRLKNATSFKNIVLMVPSSLRSMNWPTYGWAWLSAQGRPAQCRNNTLLSRYSTWNSRKAAVFLCQQLRSRSTSDIRFFFVGGGLYRQKLTMKRCSEVWQIPPGVTKFGKCFLPFSFF